MTSAVTKTCDGTPTAEQALQLWRRCQTSLRVFGRATARYGERDFASETCGIFEQTRGALWSRRAEGDVEASPSSVSAAAASATAIAAAASSTTNTTEREDTEALEKKGRRKRENKLDRRKKKRSQRPSLSEQLASIGAAAEAVTNGIRSKFGLPGAHDSKGTGTGNESQSMQCAGDSSSPQGKSTQRASVVPLLTCPARGFSVGKLRAKSGTTVTFTRGAAEYVFFHPFAASEIRMKMFYDNMEAPEVVQSRRLFRFRVNKQLDKFRGDHYPLDKRCYLEIEFAAHSAMREFSKKVLPEVLKRCAGRGRC